jgi:hypothetical protein
MDTPPLAGWENFYVITGSCAGGLIGLTFVVIALLTDSHRVRLHGLRAFVTPTIVHFAAVLTLSAYLSMPHQSLLSIATGLAAGGIAGLVYGGTICYHMTRPGSDYTPVREDWAWHVLAPSVAYGGLLACAIALHRHSPVAMFATGVIALSLLLVGIHNAWDIAVTVTLARRKDAS